MTMTLEQAKRTRHIAYYSSLATASAFVLPSLLFVTFRDLYGVSYTLLGTLVLVSFCTQLGIDLVFSFFTRFFNPHKCIKTMPLLTAAGFILYGLTPILFPQHIYIGLLLGTVIFSVAAGLGEVLVSPLVAALPSENPEKDMSKLHSMYAYGVLMATVVSTVFLRVFGAENWMYLAFFWAAPPILSCALLSSCQLPPMDASHTEQGGGTRRRGDMWLCVVCIFLGSAAENAMTHWVSTYVEKALGISKVVGDILGLAVFAVLLGLGRTLYAQYGKNIHRVLLWGMIGAVVCYVTVGFSNSPWLSLPACMLTGFCTSMLWPGMLIFMEEHIPAPGVAAYALMAAGGDTGASLAPQLMGAVVDAVAASDWAVSVGAPLSLSPEQLGLRIGMLITAVFPLIGAVLLLYMKKRFARK